MLRKLIYFILRALSAAGAVLFMMTAKYLWGLSFLGEISLVISTAVLISVISRMGGDYASYRHITGLSCTQDLTRIQQYVTSGVVTGVFMSTGLSVLVFYLYSALDMFTLDINILYVYAITATILQFVASVKRAMARLLSGYLLDGGIYFFLISIVLWGRYFAGEPVTHEYLYGASATLALLMTGSAIWSVKDCLSVRKIRERALNKYLSGCQNSLFFSVYEYFLFWAPGIISGWFYNFEMVGVIALGMRLFQLLLFGMSLINVFYAPAFISVIKEKEALGEHCHQYLSGVMKPYNMKYFLYFIFCFFISAVILLYFFVAEMDGQQFSVVALFCILGVIRCKYGPIVHIYNQLYNSQSGFFYTVAMGGLFLMCVVNYHLRSPVAMMLVYLICWIITLQYMSYKSYGGKIRVMHGS